MKHYRQPWTEPGLTILQQLSRYQQITAGKLAKETGIPTSTADRILNGGRPSLDHAIRIARYLKTSVEDIWGS